MKVNRNDHRIDTTLGDLIATISDVAFELSVSDRLKRLRNRSGLAIFPFDSVQYWTAIPAESR